jgi:hypothetical protein
MDHSISTPRAMVEIKVS